MHKYKKLILWLSIAALSVTICFFVIYFFSHSINTSAEAQENLAGNNNKHTEEDLNWGNRKDSKSADYRGENEAVGIDIIGVTAEKPLESKLVEADSINILVVGVDKQYDLYDTIMIVSVSKKCRTMKIIQIPRDTYVKYNDNVLAFLKDEGIVDLPGVFKINYSHEIGRRMSYKKNEGRFGSWITMNFLSDVIEEKFGVSVDDFIRVSTESFTEVVNLFGKVEIYVPFDMNYEDPDQDLSIHIDKGIQLLNGSQAEGFVRYRQGYDRDGNYHEYGDLVRKKNQLAFLNAFIEQHGTLGNIDKIPNVINSVNLKHSIGFGDVLFKYMGIAKDVVVNDYKIESSILEGKSQMINGSSYLVIENEGVTELPK